MLESAMVDLANGVHMGFPFHGEHEATAAGGAAGGGGDRRKSSFFHNYDDGDVSSLLCIMLVLFELSHSSGSI